MCFIVILRNSTKGHRLLRLSAHSELVSMKRTVFPECDQMPIVGRVRTAAAPSASLSILRKKILDENVQQTPSLSPLSCPVMAF